MAAEMQRFRTSEDDDDEIDMDVKEEDDDDDDDDDDEEKNMATPAMVGVDVGILSTSSSNNFMQHHQFQEQPITQGGGSRRCRPQEEKERTKLRERQRRAITAKILAGLRRHGNFNLRVRADINDVFAALAREAGWVVLPDGTTFPSRSQVHATRPVGGTSPAVVTLSSPHTPAEHTSPTSLRGISPGYQSTVNYNASHMKGSFVPSSSPYDVSSGARSQTSAMMGDGGGMLSDPPLGVSIDSVQNRQVIDVSGKVQERDFAGTPYVPVYVMLPLGVINMKCELVDPDSLVKQLKILKSIDVDGIMVDCWWGIVEAHAPQEYNWNGYKRLFQIARQLKIKLQVVMSFHECGGNVGDDVCIPLPHWVAEIGRGNPDIFFTDREGRRNPECLSWGVDKERVLRGRTAIEVYFDYMRSFRVEFDEFFDDGIISMVIVGLGPCGELRYPSNPVKHGWRYPGVGEFQCYDQYMLKSLRNAAEIRGHSFWGRGPDNTGSYNSRPHETGFFCDGGDYDGYHGRFFLNWYSQVLVDHGDRVLSLAKLAFEDTCIAAKISGIHWWYKTASHAAELTAGFYNPCNRDGYATIMAMLKRHGAALNFTCSEMSMLDQHVDFSEALAEPEGLAWQVLNAAWDVCIPVSSENALPCHDRDGYNYLLEKAKPMSDPDGRHFSAFTCSNLSPLLLERHNFVEFERFVKRMHGETVLEYQT
ncbi:beta-amylase 7-like isoform X1 [Olea europaea var. sylvestris]|uniref:Beta-amylase n=2 Tax=Olea europaea subsp. europaea TaxID=158383 RepID=A0A8S0RYC5_OLEEU|nr:beta-amylase 7-like isoform X1 [Olea europaea var. sylvestris]XP_022862306.1 beta-amylase 7-like isoform X1 [Olea europaea var. sylvestris]XP_022862313.1 beta-amylase 7-like isoform X1 [Olea europaea var. sylvestris]CAA2984246.1 beta-amylase 7-like isoform X1 [Olea europaea subsp. europaea]